MMPVLVIGGWMLAVGLVLGWNRGAHRKSTPPPPAVPVTDQLPAIPEWAAPGYALSDYWTDERVDAQFRAMVRPLSNRPL